MERAAPGIEEGADQAAVAACELADAAARHRFPYIMTAEKGMAAQEPVIVYPYTPELWERVYEAQREMFGDPPVFSCCEQHAR
ncbi:hypothetical protein ACFQ9J_21255 [Streptomyces sp. NPDC056529]|uniref:hypothetical protein n=1 Tax=Streptomyces sp. NPDC056529 TaxID=3345855 RepID=UPI003673B1ED